MTSDAWSIARLDSPLGGRLGGAPVGREALRVILGGLPRDGDDAAIGRLLGVSVG